MDQLQYITGELWEMIAPGLFTIITALIGWVLAEIGRRLPPALTAIYERKLREDLEVAATNAARAALEGDWKHFDFDKGDQRALIDYIIARMQEGAGEAIRRFEPNGQKLRQLALAGIGRVAEARLGLARDELRGRSDFPLTEGRQSAQQAADGPPL